MAELFTSIPGQVVAFEMAATLGKVTIPAELQDPKLIPSRPYPVIFAQMEWSQKTNQQFSSSLDGSIYIYVFGDQMGSLMIVGYALEQLCKGNDNGLRIVLEYYQKYRASERKIPISVFIGGSVVQGFLTGASVRAKGVAENPAPVLNEYTLEISALP